MPERTSEKSRTRSDSAPPRRGRRERLLDLLRADRPDAVADALEQTPPRRAISQLISAFYHGEPAVRWRAVTAFGVLMARIANENMEAARIVMRRLMWSLNDESGGIGWGAPEAMGEAMARHKGLADEYGGILLSYIREDGNFLEHDPLRRGALWGLLRLAETRPDFLGTLGAADAVRPYIRDSDPGARVLAALILARIGGDVDREQAKAMIGDDHVVTVYLGEELITEQVGRLVEAALAAARER